MRLRRADGLILTVLLSAGCGDDADPDATTTGAPTASSTLAPTSAAGTGSQTAILQNRGDSMEGHTPRGFAGMGTGLFIGDNLNSSFPEGDGVQAYVTFELAGVVGTEVVSAVFRSMHASTLGTPFQDLGELSAEEVRYDQFGPDLFDLEARPGGATCLFADSAAGPFSCDLTGLVQNSLDDAYPRAQIRLRFATAGDSDGNQDLALFFITDSNTNEPGIFELEVQTR